MPAEGPAAQELDNPDVVVTFVHGTWGRGVFPALRISQRPFWFEPGGAFRDKLLTRLQSRGLKCSFDAFLWSGANSIIHRREAAKRLAQQLTDNVKRSPNIKQVVIAHSHGGNVTARALGYLDSKISDLRICYLATPFLEVLPRNVKVEENLNLGLLAMLWFFFLGLIPFSILAANISVGPPDFDILLLFSMIAGWLVFIWSTSKRSQARNEELVQATKASGHDRSHRDSLILRAIDDEASLALASGTIANLLTSALTSKIVLLLYGIMELSSCVMLTSIGAEGLIFFKGAFYILAPLSLLALVSRGVFGRELLHYPPGTQMNMQSVPDCMGSPEIRTLLREDSSLLFALRHSVYDHPNASGVVADWICADEPPVGHLSNSGRATAANRLSTALGQNRQYSE